MGLFGGLFWGIFLLASGLIILLRLAFNLQVSSGKLIFGLFILLMGVSLLTSNFGWNNIRFNNDNTVVFSSGQEVNPQNGNDYFVIFGSTNYDLTDLEPGAHVKINCDFGSCRVKLPSKPVQVNATGAFGNIRLPDGSNIPFGNGSYTSEGDNKIIVDVSCAFGSVAVSNS